MNITPVQQSAIDSFGAMTIAMNLASKSIPEQYRCDKEISIDEQHCSIQINEKTMQVKGWFKLTSSKKIEVDKIKLKRATSIKDAVHESCFHLFRSFLEFKRENQDFIAKSRHLSRLLRHDPSLKNLTVDSNGWCSVQLLVDNSGINFETLKLIVDTDDKGRYSFSDSLNQIRANQGHSLPNVDIDNVKAQQPPSLYHGTSPTLAKAILSSGAIKRMGRNEIHLSSDIETARTVGARKCNKVENPSIFQIVGTLKDLELSDNGVYLTKTDIPVEKLKLLTEEV